MNELPQERPLVGPGAAEREQEKVLTPENVRLEKDLPIYYALLADPGALALSASEVQDAKSRLSAIINKDPQEVLSCQGKTLEEAKAILESIERSQNQQAA